MQRKQQYSKNSSTAKTAVQQKQQYSMNSGTSINSNTAVRCSYGVE